MRARPAVPALVLLAALALVPPLAAEGQGPTLSLRAGVPTDVLVNIGKLYSWGAALEAGAAWQVKPWIILGGQVTYGFGVGMSPAVPAVNHEICLAGRAGVGSLDSFSVSLVAGAAWFPLGSIPLVVDLGVCLDYGPVSLGLSVGSVSVGLNLRL